MPQQKSVEFAKEAYQIVNKTISAGTNGGVAIAAEEHFDRPDPDHMEPALQAVYLHIALLESLRHRFGEDQIHKIHLGVELSENNLNFITTSIENASGEVPERLRSYPMIYAIQHAMKLGIEVQAIDTYADYNGERIGPSADRREHTIQQNIINMGRENPDGFSMIIRGANHLSNDLGISNEKIIESEGNIKADLNQNPYKSTFRHIYYFNAAHPNPEQLNGSGLDEKIISAESRYYTGTDVVQIHAAPTVRDLKQVDIVKDVEEAAHLIESEISNKKTSSLSQNLLREISEFTISEQQIILGHIQQQTEMHRSKSDSLVT